MIELAPGTFAVACVSLFLVLLFLGVPVFLSLGATCAVFAVLTLGFQGSAIMLGRVWGQMMSFPLVAVPLFIFMGCVLERTGIADELFEMFHYWLGRWRGGLAIAVVWVSAIIGAMSAVSGAAAVTMGIVALPAMLKRGYGVEFSLGSIAAASTLCIMIPPSITLILIGYYGNVSVGQLFAAALVPGLIIATIFSLYIVVYGYFRPSIVPIVVEKFTLRERTSKLIAAVPALALIMLVLGSIFSGAATPTEAAAVGAFGSIVAGTSLRRLNWLDLKQAMNRAVRVTCMVFAVLVTSAVFGGVLQAGGISIAWIRDVVQSSSVHAEGIMGFTLFVAFVAGLVGADLVPMVTLLPIAFPLLAERGTNLVWFSLVYNIFVMQGYVTPPYGLSIFYVRAVSPQYVTSRQIYRAVLPWTLLYFVSLAVIFGFPDLSLWLPRLMFGTELVH